MMINMDRVVKLAQKGLPGVPIWLLMSGGNTATIYVGESYTGVDDDIYFFVIAGPGIYEPFPSVAWTEEFTVGFDRDLDSAPGGPEVQYYDRPHPSLDRETRAAFRIKELYEAHPRRRW